MTVSTTPRRLIPDVARGARRFTLGLTLSLTLGVTLGLFASIAEAAPQATAPAAAEAGGGPALWVIRDPDSTLYLFGTVHVLRPDTEWTSPRVEAAYQAASEIWLEVADLDDQAALAPLIQQHGLAPARPLSSLLTPEDLAALDAAARAIGASGAQMEPMRPWLAALTLAVAAPVRAGYDPTSGVEMKLMARAREDGKPLRGFETLDQQVSILAGLEEADQVAFLRATLRDFGRAVEMLDEMVGAWSVGDMETLERVAVAPMKAETPAAYDAMLTRRNIDWADQIETLLEGSGTAFIAVGAAHLAGEDSVQTLLARRGVIAERIAP